MLRFPTPLTLTILLAGASGLFAQDKDIKVLADNFADRLAKMSKKSVGVVDFTDLQGNVTELGRYLAEQVSVALATTDKGIEVVDRAHLKVLLQENKLGSSGIIDPVTAQKLGKIAGVEILVTGTLTPFGDSVQLAVKALDASTARIIGASTTDIARTKAIEELLGRGIQGASTLGSGPGIEPAPSQPQPAVNAEDFSFAPVNCKMNAGYAACMIKVTNLGDSIRSLGLWGRNSTLIDESGNQYKSQWVKFGAGATLASGGNTSTGCFEYCASDIPPNLPVNLLVRFEGVAAALVRGNIILRTWSPKEVSVLLRNIPFAK